MKWPFWLGVNQTFNQKGQEKEKGSSRWPWLSKIGQTNLTFVKQA